MKYGLLFFVLLAGCSEKQTSSPMPVASPDILIKTEEAFSKMSEDSGFHHALKAYMAHDATKLVDKRLPLIGADSIAALLDSRSDTGFVITWKARHADIASSGDLGYTWGDWIFRTKSPSTAMPSTSKTPLTGDTLYGNYYTIWKKQPDGSWKWVLDGGNTTPKP